jgi:hypothetical protein
LDKGKQELRLADKLGEDSNCKAVENRRKTLMKVCESEIKQVNRFTCPGSAVEKNGEIQNEISGRIRKASKFYHLIMSIL